VVVSRGETRLEVVVVRPLTETQKCVIRTSQQAGRPVTSLLLWGTGS